MASPSRSEASCSWSRTCSVALCTSPACAAARPAAAAGRSLPVGGDASGCRNALHVARQRGEKEGHYYGLVTRHYRYLLALIYTSAADVWKTKRPKAKASRISVSPARGRLYAPLSSPGPSSCCFPVQLASLLLGQTTGKVKNMR